LSYNTEFSGKCSRCGREYHSKHSDDVVCDCWTKCPECGAVMEAYVPELSLPYGLDGIRDLLVWKVCNNLVGHSDHSPFYSKMKPVEVELTNAGNV
jgi:hypothetical protein